MKQLLKLIGTALQWLIMAVVLLLFAPLIILALICFALDAAYEKMWSLIRHDPKKDITIKKLEDDAWPSAKTKDDFIDAFKNISNKLAELANASQGDIEYKGFKVFETPSEITKWADLELAQTLTTEHAEVRLRWLAVSFQTEMTRGYMSMQKMTMLNLVPCFLLYT